MAKNDFITVNVKPDTKEELEDLKIHPNQSFDEVIKELLESKDNS